MQATKAFVQQNSYITVDMVSDESGIYPAFVEEDQEVLLNYGAQLVLEFPENAKFESLSCLRIDRYRVVYDRFKGQEYLLFSINENNEFLFKFTEELVHELKEADAYFLVIVNPTEVTPIPTSVWDRPNGSKGNAIFVAIFFLILLFTVVFTLWVTST